MSSCGSSITAPPAARAVVAGDVDVAMSPTALVISQIANADVNLVAIYGFPNPDFALGTTDPAKATCADVKGQQVGVDTPGGARSIALKDMLAAAAALSLDDVQQVALGSNTAQAMIAGQLAYGVLHLDDVPEIESHGKKVTIDHHPRSSPSRRSHNDPDRRAQRPAGAKSATASCACVAGLIAADRFMADPKNADRVARSAPSPATARRSRRARCSGYLDIGLWAIE